LGVGQLGFGSGHDPEPTKPRTGPSPLCRQALAPEQRGDRLAARTGFDPGALATPSRWFRISPRRIQAWREVNELMETR
jgi:hypothetical protein